MELFSILVPFVAGIALVLLAWLIFRELSRG